MYIIALELVLKVCSWQTPSAWPGNLLNVRFSSPTWMNRIKALGMGPGDQHLPTNFDNHCPERQMITGEMCFSPAPWFYRWEHLTSGKKTSIKWQGSLVAELRLRVRHLPPSPACSPRLGGDHHRPESPRPTDETKAPPEAWKLPFGMRLLQETSMLPLFLVMCYHRQSSWTESLTRIKGARKADLLWRLCGPAAHKARLPGARWETWLWERKQPMDGLLGLPGCLWYRAEI